MKAPLLIRRLIIELWHFCALWEWADADGQFSHAGDFRGSMVQERWFRGGSTSAVNEIEAEYARRLAALQEK